MTRTGRWHPEPDPHPDQERHDTVDLLRRHAEEKAQENMTDAVYVGEDVIDAAITGFTLSAASIEKDVRVCDLTEDEVRMIVGDALNAVFNPLPSPPAIKGE